jgi:hypothetical protein
MAVDVLTKTLQNEFTTVDRAAVRTIVAKGLERGMNPRALRVACALVGSQTSAKALDNAKFLGGDTVARILVDISMLLGRARGLMGRTGNNPLVKAILRTLIREFESLAGSQRDNR